MTRGEERPPGDLEDGEPGAGQVGNLLGSVMNVSAFPGEVGAGGTREPGPCRGLQGLAGVGTRSVV